MFNALEFVYVKAAQLLPLFVVFMIPCCQEKMTSFKILINSLPTVITFLHEILLNSRYYVPEYYNIADIITTEMLEHYW